MQRPCFIVGWGKRTESDGCADKEDWRDVFKILLVVMSGDGGGEKSAGERDSGEQSSVMAEHKLWDRSNVRRSGERTRGRKGENGWTVGNGTRINVVEREGQ